MKESKRKVITYVEIQKQLNSTLQDLSATLKDVETLMEKYFNNLEMDNPEFVRKINDLNFVAKVLEINIKFLSVFINTYEEDTTISATLARGIFELHLIFLEAISNKTNFVKVFIKTHLAYEAFIDKFLQMAEEKNDRNAMNTFHIELVRIGLIRKKYEKLLNIDLKPKNYGHFFSSEN